MSEFNDFTENLIKECSNQAKILSEHTLILDIINIYNKRFKDYDAYLSYMYAENKFIKYYNDRFVCNYRLNISYRPLHIILEKDLFDFINSLIRNDEYGKEK